MKNTIYILSIAILCSCNSQAPEQNVSTVAKDKASEMTNGASDASASNNAVTKKYETKSCIITSSSTQKMAGMNIKNTVILYIDDFGNKECKEEFENDPVSNKEKLAKTTFSKDGFLYSYSSETKEGSRRKSMGTGIEARFDIDQMPAKMKEEYKVKELPEENLCGKTCKGYTMETPSGITTVFGWNKIILKTSTNSPKMGIKTELVASKIEENASIPSSKFEIPGNVKITNY